MEYKTLVKYGRRSDDQRRQRPLYPQSRIHLLLESLLFLLYRSYVRTDPGTFSFSSWSSSLAHTTSSTWCWLSWACRTRKRSWLQGRWLSKHLYHIIHYIGIWTLISVHVFIVSNVSWRGILLINITKLWNNIFLTNCVFYVIC